MAKSEKRREKKLMARRAQRKEQSRQVARVRSASPRDRMLMSATWPIVESRFSEEHAGIRQALLARRGPSGQVAGALFLVDSYCLGVKDVMARIYSPEEWVDLLESLDETELRFIDVTPEDVRKLIEEAVDYAQSFGLAPHADYAAASPIFGNIDASQSDAEFEFGQDGQPFYVAGPNDSEVRSREVIRTLERTVGTSGFRVAAYTESDD